MICLCGFPQEPITVCFYTWCNTQNHIPSNRKSRVVTSEKHKPLCNYEIKTRFEIFVLCFIIIATCLKFYTSKEPRWSTSRASEHLTLKSKNKFAIRAYKPKPQLVFLSNDVNDHTCFFLLERACNFL